MKKACCGSKRVIFSVTTTKPCVNNSINKAKQDFIYGTSDIYTIINHWRNIVFVKLYLLKYFKLQPSLKNNVL